MGLESHRGTGDGDHHCGDDGEDHCGEHVSTLAIACCDDAKETSGNREPGLAGATMDDDKVMASIIPDGHHVDFAAIRIAKQVMKERLFVITDAVTETELGPYRHHFEGDKYASDGILSGSALTMYEAVNRLVKQVGIPWEEASRMCSLYPARVIGMEREAGRIRRGWSANMMLLDKELNLLRMIGAG